MEQGTDEWREARAGVITGTRLKKACAKDPTDFIYELVAETIAPTEDTYVSDAMERGTELEPEAIEAYEAETGILTEEVGFCLHDEYDWLGLSPDRLIKTKGKYTKAVEAKCPGAKTQLKYISEGGIPTEYRHQVLHYFIVCDTLKELDFITYNPDISIERLQLHIVTVTREQLQPQIENTLEILGEFRKQWDIINDRLTF